MVIGIGTDLIEIARIAQSMGRYGDRFLQRVFTPGEIAYCRRKKNAAESFAAVGWTSGRARPGAGGGNRLAQPDPHQRRRTRRRRHGELDGHPSRDRRTPRAITPTLHGSDKHNSGNYIQTAPVHRNHAFIQHPGLYL